MRVIELDVAECDDGKDVFSLLLKALGAPDWHGFNLNALYDSMIAGGINQVEAPYSVRFLHLASASAETRQTVSEIADAVGGETTRHPNGDLEFAVMDQLNPPPTP